MYLEERYTSTLKVIYLLLYNNIYYICIILNDTVKKWGTKIIRTSLHADRWWLNCWPMMAVVKSLNCFDCSWTTKLQVTRLKLQKNCGASPTVKTPELRPLLCHRNDVEWIKPCARTDNKTNTHSQNELIRRVRNTNRTTLWRPDRTTVVCRFRPPRRRMHQLWHQENINKDDTTFSWLRHTVPLVGCDGRIGLGGLIWTARAGANNGIPKHNFIGLTINGESANTSKDSGLWVRLRECVNREMLCFWCLVHR